MFDIEELKSQIEQFRFDSDSVRKIIAPFLIDELNMSKIIELCHLGKFLNNLNENYEIVTLTESPDFIIGNNTKKIGVEIVGVYNKNIVESEKFKQQLVKFAERLFAEKYPGINLLANIYLSNDELKISKKEIPVEAEKIADFVYDHYNKQQPRQLYHRIKDVKCLNHTNLSFSYNPAGYVVNRLTLELVQEVISKKEKKINSYNEKNLDELWLLIVVSNSSPESYEIFSGDQQFFKGYSSEFNRIYILEDFKSKIHCIT